MTTADAARPERSEKAAPSREVTEVTPGVLRSQLPISLPGLGHVNCYLLEDDRGFAVVDPGLPNTESWNALGDRLAQAGGSFDAVHTAVVTHSHIDHFGNAYRLSAEYGAEIVAFESFGLGPGLDSGNDEDEFATPDDPVFHGDEGADTRPSWERNRITPWGTVREMPPVAVQETWAKGDQAISMFLPPRPSQTVTDRQTISLAGRDWVAVHTPGHTNDHLCLYDPVNQVMLSGDHVLPTITPHVGGTDSGADTLAKFMDSLQLMHEFAEVSQVLPAHGDPFTDLNGRADEICHHHFGRLDELREAATGAESGSVTDFMRALFRERSWGYLAERETYAHLEHLRLQGELNAHRHGDVLIYELAQQAN